MHDFDKKIEAANIGCIKISRIDGSGRQLVGTNVPSDGWISVEITKASIRSTDFNKEIISPEAGIVTVSLTPFQWGELISSFNIGDGTPCTIDRMNGKLIDQEYVPVDIGDFYSERFNQNVKLSTKKIDDLIGEAKEILNNKKTVSKADREKLNAAYSKVTKLIHDEIPFMKKLLAEDVGEQLSHAQSQLAFNFQEMKQKNLKIDSSMTKEEWMRLGQENGFLDSSTLLE